MGQEGGGEQTLVLGRTMSRLIELANASLTQMSRRGAMSGAWKVDAAACCMSWCTVGSR